jgi:PEP-CTERM motif
MKRILMLVLLGLALPMAAFANNSVEFGNNGGTLSGSSAGLSLSGSVLTSVYGLNGLGLVTGNDLGSVSFNTGALISGSLSANNPGMVPSFFAGGAGSSFVITGNGSNGIPNSIIFSGTFSGPVKWSFMTEANGTHSYTLQGTLTGTWYNGTTVDGATVQLVYNTGKGFFNGSSPLGSGDTNMTVPEPGTLGLLGTGLLGLAGVLRRKFKA